MNKTSSKPHWRALRRRVDNYFISVDSSENESTSLTELTQVSVTSNMEGSCEQAACFSYNMDVEEPVITMATPLQTITEDDTLQSGQSEWRFVDDCSDTDCFNSDSDCDDKENAIADLGNLQNDLAEWACSYKITHAAINGLLKCLQKNGLHVPLCAKTLLKTPTSVEVCQKSGGDYVYFGLSKSLLPLLLGVDVGSASDTLNLSFNVDGLPLFKSSRVSLWPILCDVTNLKHAKPFAVALFCGSAKPVDLEFVGDFLTELKLLTTTGIECNGKTFKVSVHSIVCDAPAKCMLKGIVQYNGYYGCDRCEQKGIYDGHMLYLDTKSKLRTDMSFRQQSNPEHHKKISPFCEIPIDMIESFPLDYMHVVNLGVTKRLLLLWMSGPLKTRLSAGQINQISANLKNIRQFMPSDFVRQPRSLDHVRLWKATEFRQFLLYTGPLVLKDVMPRQFYMNFMYLHVGICLLMNETLVQQYATYAGQLLEYFVTDAMKIYGNKFISYNVHSLVHLADVARRFGCLENCNAYKFENYLQTLKRLIRSGKKPLTQVAHRLYEIQHSYATAASSSNSTDENVSILLKAKSPNNCFQLENGEFCLVNAIDNESGSMTCEVFRQASPMYKDPCDSRLLNVFKVNLRQSIIKNMPISVIQCKGIFVTLDNISAAVMPLVHAV